MCVCVCVCNVQHTQTYAHTHTHTHTHTQTHRMYPQLLSAGNYPVQLKIATSSSSYTTVEFVLHLMKEAELKVC